MPRNVAQNPDEEEPIEVQSQACGPIAWVIGTLRAFGRGGVVEQIRPTLSRHTVRSSAWKRDCVCRGATSVCKANPPSVPAVQQNGPQTAQRWFALKKRGCDTIDSAHIEAASGSRHTRLGG